MRRFQESELLVATHNSGKLEEFQELLSPFGIRCLSNRDFNLPEPDETETTFVGNARLKAQAAVKATGLPALADDSGIEVHGLDGAPGVHTADWAETPDGRDFGMAMTRVWEALEARGASEPRLATFRATLVLLWPDGEEAIFEGSLNGRLVWPMRGVEGHGYDPMFQPDGHSLTLGEMSPAQKNAISHRARALQEMSKILDGPGEMTNLPNG